MSIKKILSGRIKEKRRLQSDSRNKKMRIYLDNCCFNRPYDNQTYEIIRLETEAIIFVQNCIKDNRMELVWSFILDFENSANPYKEKRELIKEWRSVSADNIKATESIRTFANELQSYTELNQKILSI